MSVGLLPIQVDVPSVPVVAGDPAALRRVASDLGSVAEQTRQASFRLQGAVGWVVDDSWCGPASTAFLVSARELCVWLDNARSALEQAASTCGSLAAGLDQAQADLRTASSAVAAILTDRADLVRRNQALQDQAALACPAAVLPGDALVCDDPAFHAERVRLQADVDELAARAQRVQSLVVQATQVARRSGEAAAAALDAIAAMTSQARAARERVLLQAEQQRELRAANAGWANQAKGAWHGLLADAFIPLSMLTKPPSLLDPRQLVDDVKGDLEQVAHPVDAATSAADVEDLSEGAYGRWVATVVPNALLDLGSDGAAAEADTAQEAEEAEAAERSGEAAGAARDVVAARLDEAVVEATLADAEASLAAEPAYSWGGVARHEGLTGGGGSASHTIAMHVGKTLDFLKDRLAKKVRGRLLPMVSTFVDERSANKFIDQALTASSTAIEQWLASGKRVDGEAFLASSESIGQVLLRGATQTIDGHRLKVILRRDPAGPQGFRILTVKICP